MAKTAIDVNFLVTSFIERLVPEFDVDRVLFIGESYEGIDEELSDVRFIVVSPTFEGMDHLSRAEKLGLVGLDVSPVIQAWPFTPTEVADHLRGAKYDLFLAQFLPGSREVYGKSSRKSLRKAAGGNR